MDNLYLQINTRVRADLVQAIKRRAKNNHRKMQAEIELIFISALEEVKLENTEEKQPCNTQ